MGTDIPEDVLTTTIWETLRKETDSWVSEVKKKVTAALDS